MNVGPRHLAAVAALALLVAVGLVHADQPAPAPASTATTGSPGGTRVMTVLHHIAETLRTSSYRHDLRVVEREGRYEFDCSSMAAWVLWRSAPHAQAVVARISDRPVAVDYYRTILHAPAVAHHGWTRVARVADARPGDVLAWQRPPWFPSHNTGHVAFVVDVPTPYEGGMLVRVADASSYTHEDDTRVGRTGYGEGTMLVTTDAAGGGTGYGWFGTMSGNWIVPTQVVIGRPVD